MELNTPSTCAASMRASMPPPSSALVTSRQDSVSAELSAPQAANASAEVSAIGRAIRHRRDFIIFPIWLGIHQDFQNLTSELSCLYIETPNSKFLMNPTNTPDESKQNN